MFRQAREIKEAANTTTVEDGIEVYSCSLNNKKGNGGIENPPQIDQNLDVINKTEILQENKPPEIIKEYDDAKVLTTPKIVQVKPAQNMKSEREVSPIITTFDLRKYKNATPVVSSKPINNDYDSNYSTSFAKHLERQEKEKERRRVIHMRKERMNISHQNELTDRSESRKEHLRNEMLFSNDNNLTNGVSIQLSGDPILTVHHQRK